MKNDVVHEIPGIRIVGICPKVQSSINGDHLNGLPKRLECSVEGRRPILTAANDNGYDAHLHEFRRYRLNGRSGVCFGNSRAQVT